MVKKADVLLLIIITLFALIFILLFSRYEKRQPRGAFIAVTIDGKVVKTVPLSENGSYEMKENGFTNVFNIADGQAKMTHADCPDGLCLRQKSISHTDETIVCLPHKLILKVVGGAQSDVDAVAK